MRYAERERVQVSFGEEKMHCRCRSLTLEVDFELLFAHLLQQRHDLVAARRGALTGEDALSREQRLRQPCDGLAAVRRADVREHQRLCRIAAARKQPRLAAHISIEKSLRASLELVRSICREMDEAEIQVDGLGVDISSFRLDALHQRWVLRQERVSRIGMQATKQVERMLVSEDALDVRGGEGGTCPELLADDVDGLYDVHIFGLGALSPLLDMFCGLCSEL